MKLYNFNGLDMHPRVREWLDIRAPLERQLAPLGLAAMDMFDLRAGDHVLDIGCGIGDTPMQLADRVGPSGQVTAIDVLPSAIEVAASAAALPSNITFVAADAEHHRFASGSFDAAFSRFGVMFFSDPVATFKQIGGAMRHGGRFAFVCWRSLSENALDHVPLRAAAPHLPVALLRQTDDASWFSFSDADHVHSTLTAAGWTDIRIVAHDRFVGSGSLDDMVAVCSRVGALGAILRQNPEFRGLATAALVKTLRSLDGPDGPLLRAATWVVSARMPG